MTKEEFMSHAESEINDYLRKQGHWMLNLLEQAWAKGKKNAEIESVVGIAERAIRIAQERTRASLTWPVDSHESRLDIPRNEFLGLG